MDCFTRTEESKRALRTEFVWKKQQATLVFNAFNILFYPHAPEPIQYHTEDRSGLCYLQNKWKHFVKRFLSGGPVRNVRSSSWLQQPMGRKAGSVSAVVGPARERLSVRGGQHCSTVSTVTPLLGVTVQLLESPRGPLAAQIPSIELAGSPYI